MLQAQVVPWWGTGRPAELSPSGSNPVSDTANRQEDRGDDYKTESFQGPRDDLLTAHFRGIRSGCMP